MFGEKKTEMNLPVWQTPKYEESKKKALEIIDKYDSITEGDFWILMNKTKNKDKMMYTGLIISHNGCLKLNDTLPDDEKFKPECVEVDKDGFGESLVYTYCNPSQGIYEVGEVSKTNCKNDYPYAMAFKRCFDRVVLKVTKLAYAGIYSDSEADEFKAPAEAEDVFSEPMQISESQLKTLNVLIETTGTDPRKMCEYYHISNLAVMNTEEFADAVEMLKKKGNRKGAQA